MSDDLVDLSDALVFASESLLNRVTCEGEFPYTATLSRIHHLGKVIRDSLGKSKEFAVGPATADEVSPAQVIETAPVAHEPRVLIIDDSPFFRMLLTSAIESSGLPVETATNFTEAEASCDSNAFNLVICAASEQSAVQNWLRHRVHDEHLSLILLTHETVPAADVTATVLPIRRTDLTSLLNAVHTRLGITRKPIPLSA